VLFLVEKLPPSAPPPGSARDTVSLGWEDRSRTRQRLRTRDGRELAIKLPTGTRLVPGTILAIGEGFHVEVEAAPEDVWVVRAADRRHLLRAAWEIGNRHFPIDLGEDEIAVLYDHTLEELWTRLGVEAERRRRPFLAEMRPSQHHS
jgi:urease accessory protein